MLISNRPHRRRDIGLLLSSGIGRWRHKLRSVLPALPEFVTLVAGVLGWLCCVAALADVLGYPVAVWKAGIGVLLLSLCGFKLAWRIATDGIYVTANRDRLVQSARRPPDTIQE